MALDPSTERLLAPLPPDQQLLINAIAEVFFEHSDWPKYPHLHHRLLQTGFDLDSAVRQMPVVTSAGRQSWSYGCIWYDSVGLPHDLSTFALTGAGLYHVTGKAEASASALLTWLVETANYLALRFRADPVDPFATERPLVLVADVSQYLATHLMAPSAQDLLHLRKVAEHEPILAWCGWNSGPDEGSFSLHKHILQLEGPGGWQDYLDRTIRWVNWANAQVPGQLTETPIDLRKSLPDEQPTLPASPPDQFEYDIALSFAGENREYVKQVAAVLTAAGVRVFHDEQREAELWGENAQIYFANLYRKQARFVIVVVSSHYASKPIPQHEWRSSLARALSEPSAYILPVRLDDTELPGLLPTTIFVDGRIRTPTEIADLAIAKLRASQGQ